MNKILLIDTSSSKEIQVGLRIDEKEYHVRQKISSQKAQAVLPMIDKLLKQRAIGLKDFKLIEVHAGSGSFTGIRVGMSIANALSFTLKIPIKKI